MTLISQLVLLAALCAVALSTESAQDSQLLSDSPLDPLDTQAYAADVDHAFISQYNALAPPGNPFNEQAPFESQQYSGALDNSLKMQAMNQINAQSAEGVYNPPVAHDALTHAAEAALLTLGRNEDHSMEGHVRASSFPPMAYNHARAQAVNGTKTPSVTQRPPRMPKPGATTTTTTTTTTAKPQPDIRKKPASLKSLMMNVTAPLPKRANLRQNQVMQVAGDQGAYDISGAGGAYEPLPAQDTTADTRFTIQNVFSGEYLYIDDAKGVDDSVVQTGTVETIQARHSNHALFRLEWTEDLYVRIVCVDNDVMLTGTLAPHVEQHPVAPVIASRIPSAAALWSLGEISWSPDTGETMFIINHKYTDFLFAIGDPSKKKPALTTRHVKYYGLARSRWIVRPFHD